MERDHDPMYCIEQGCGRRATHERALGVTAGGIPMTEVVCIVHADDVSYPLGISDGM